MTKLKNTKKGMAKKALSVSLVAAMLATSNVPVWAAEDLFTDGSAAVEAPVVEEPAAEVEAFSAEPAEEVVADAPALQQAETTGPEYSVELSGFTVGGTPIENNATEWGGSLSTTVSVTADKEIKGAVLKASWRVDGNAISENYLPITADGKTYPCSIDLTSDMARKPVTLFVYAEKDGAVVWSYTSEAVTVQPKDISKYVKLAVTGSTTYTGDVIQPTAAPEWLAGQPGDPITNDIGQADDYEFSYHGSDFVNVTGEKLTVKATPKNDAYTGSIETTYQIAPNTISGSIDSVMKASFKNTSIKYNGDVNTAKVKKEDIVLLDKKTDVDLSNYLAVDENGYVTVVKSGDGTWRIPIIAGTPDTGYKNYNIDVQQGRGVTSSNALEVEARSLDSLSITIDPIQSKTGVVVTADKIKNNIHIVDKESKEDLTDELIDDLSISVPNNAILPGIYSVTIEPKATVSMLTGSAVVELKLFNLDINEAGFPGFEWKGEIVNIDKYYTGEAVTFTSEEIGVPQIRNQSNTEWVPLVEGRDYEITYSNNIKAGTAQMFVIGKGNYENSIKKLTFEIKQTPVSSATVNDYIEIIDTEDPADYKDAMGLVVKAKVPGTNKELTLVEGTDYTVKYKFDGKNVAGNTVSAEITLKKNGNFAENKDVSLTVKSTLTKAALKSEYIKFKEGSTFTYTGQEIEPAFDVVIGGRIIDPKNYDVRYTNNTDAGTATLTIEGVAGGDYQGKASVNYTINPADSADLVGVIPTQEYRGYSIDIPAEDIDLTLNGNKIDVAKNFTLTYGENLNIGEGTVTLTPKSGNFTGTKELTFQITGEMLIGTGSFTYHDENGFLIDGTKKVFNYDGTAQTFAKTTLTFKEGNNVKALTEGTDYEIVYVDNVYGQKGSDNKQYAAVLAVAKGKYGGNLTTTDNKVNVKDGIYTDAEGNKTVNVFAMDLIEINQQEVQLSNVTVSNGTYAAGLPVKPEVSIVVKGVKLVEGKDYDLDLSENKDIINATATKSLTVSIDFKNGYKAGNTLDSDRENNFAWGIDKFNLANAEILVNGDNVTVKCGSVDVPSSEYTVARDGEADTITVTATEGNKNYTGSKTVSAIIETPDEKPDAPVIQEVKVSGNNATVVLAGESDAATGYDYVISTDRDCITNKDYDKVNRNVLNTETTFTYTQQGVYYAYCHAWKRVNGEKVFSDWSNAYPFVVSAVTPEQPVITSVKKSGRNLTVTWTQSANATTGYDIVMGTELRKVNGEIRPVEYGKAVKKLGPNTYSVTFRSIPKGTYYVALHAHNRTSETGVKVFSPWSNYKKVTF